MNGPEILEYLSCKSYSKRTAQIQPNISSVRVICFILPISSILRVQVS